MLHDTSFALSIWSLQDTLDKLAAMFLIYRLRVLAIAVFLIATGALSAAVWWYSYGSALEELDRRAQSDLALASDSLTGELKRYRELAVLAADHPAILPMVTGQVSADAITPLLREMADKTGTLDILVVDRSGQVLASAGRYVQRDQGDQPYFQRAMDGAMGVHHLFSTAYDRRVFVFAAPVFSPEGPVVGSLIVFSDIEAVEASWRGGRPAVFFTDELGVVFVSNRSELVFRSRTGDVRGADLSAQYPTGQVTGFVEFIDQTVLGHPLWRVDGGRYLPDTALHLTLELPVIDMTGEILLDVAPAQRLARLQAAVAAALCLAFGVSLFWLMERRRTLAQANTVLEARVADRTVALSQVNDDLRSEVAVRVAAEAKLKQAQADLVQAGKLSALGQMSAGISHELNQPLMAIRSFAENGQGFLERGKPEVAAQNLGRISELARRMGRIIQNLRSFARQESVPLRDVAIDATVEAVLEMVATKAAQAGVVIHWQPPAAPVVVRGGEVRLQQVVVNLVSNAIDAMEQSPVKEVTIGLDTSGARVVLSVRDTGPGITEPERIFDPFYSTKEVGAAEGMGLGLSISYGLVQSFGGAIRGRNHADGGAVFTIELDRATQDEKVEA